jgi:hypothetical protein
VDLYFQQALLDSQEYTCTGWNVEREQCGRARSRLTASTSVACRSSREMMMMMEKVPCFSLCLQKKERGEERRSGMNRIEVIHVIE